MHRKIPLLPVLAILLACLTGCGGRTGQPPDMEAVLEEIREQVELPDMYRLTEKRILDRYGLDAGAMEQAIFLVCENGLQVDEIWLIRAADALDAQSAAAAAEEHIRQLCRETEEYLPEQYAVVREGIVLCRDEVLALFISPEADTMAEILEDVLSG